MTTDRIRVIPVDDASNGQTANDNLVSLTEIEVRSPAGAGQIRTQRFDAWGRLEQAAGSVPTYGFTGREPDATGLIHYRARYYHPELGRFVSRDPLGLAAGINPYAYADGNPVLFNDPDGMLAKLAWNSVKNVWNDAAQSIDDERGAADRRTLPVAFDFNKFANQVEQNRSSTAADLAVLAGALAVGTMPKTPGELRGLGVPKSDLNPYTGQMSRWSSRLGVRELRVMGRSAGGVALGAVATGALIFDGFYNWGVIGQAAWDATSFGGN